MNFKRWTEELKKGIRPENDESSRNLDMFYGLGTGNSTEEHLLGPDYEDSGAENS